MTLARRAVDAGLREGGTESSGHQQDRSNLQLTRRRIREWYEIIAEQRRLSMEDRNVEANQMIFADVMGRGISRQICNFPGRWVLTLSLSLSVELRSESRVLEGYR